MNFVGSFYFLLPRLILRPKPCLVADETVDLSGTCKRHKVFTKNQKPFVFEKNLFSSSRLAAASSTTENLSTSLVIDLQCKFVEFNFE